MEFSNVFESHVLPCSWPGPFFSRTAETEASKTFRFLGEYLKEKAQPYRAPVAQLVEHRAVTREVVSSTPAGPNTLGL